jgi:hypothetical protein
MFNRKKLVITAALVGLAQVAEASSPDAWKDLYAKAGTACISATSLKGAAVRRDVGNFTGALLLIVDGRHPNGMRGTAYCLYDKTTAKTETTSAERTDVAATIKMAPSATGRTCWTESFRAQLKSPRPIGSSCTAKNDEGDDYTGVVRR